MPKEPLFKVGRYWGALVPGSKFVYIFWYEPGARDCRRRSSKTTDPQEAERIAASWLLAEGPAEAGDPKDVAIVSVLTRYWEDYSDQRRNPSAPRRAGTLLLDFLGDNAAKVSVLTEAKQIAFIEHLHKLGKAVAYISKIQSFIAAALNRATKERYGKMLLYAPEIIVKNAEIAALLDVPEPTPRNWHPTLKQIAAHCDAAENTDVLRMTLLTLLFAGRPEAIEEAGTDQFDAENRLIAWNARGRRQTKKYRPTAPVPPSLLPYMTAWAEEGEKFIAEAIRGPWERTCKATGLSFTPQSLRHFMSSEMRRRKVSKEDSDEYRGHRRQTTGDRYGIFDPDWLSGPREVAESLISELQALCEKDIFRQVAVKPKYQPIRGKGGKFVRYEPKVMVGATGIEPVTPAMSTHRKVAKSA